MKFLDKLRNMKHYDKLLHFVGGLVVAGVFYASIHALVQYIIATNNLMLAYWVGMMPIGLLGMYCAALVHGSKEFNDYLAMKRGENATPSLLDFLAGMAGSFVGLYVLF